MKLYINNKEAFFSTDFDANMTFKFLDTYNPSAVKTPYSKTISLPDCKRNAEIFGDFQLKYSFDLFNDDGRIIEKGYCILDNIKTVGLDKTYNVTLYGGLGDFFYNLKGDDSNPRTLADLYWGDITELSEDEENSVAILTWDPEYAFSTWISPEDYPIWDTFRAVPCIYDDGKMDNSKTIIPADSAPELFPSRSQDTSGSSYFSTEDFTRGLLVESDESTCYGKQDFRVDFMPLGIKYKSLIEMCCKPYNNGGYTVNLDPDFFNASNPYWTNMFLLKSLPTQDYDYTTSTGSFNNFTCSIISIGNFKGPSTSPATSTLEPRGSSDIWTATANNSIQLQSDVEVIENKVYYEIHPFIEVDLSQVPDLDRPAATYLTSQGDIQVTLYATNLDTGQTTIVGGAGYASGTEFGILQDDNHSIHIKDLYMIAPLHGVANLSPDWTNIRFYLRATNSSPSTGYTLHYIDRYLWTNHWRTRNVRGDLKVPSKKTYTSENLQTVIDQWASAGVEWPLRLPDSYLRVNTLYSGESNPFRTLDFTKKDLLGNTKSPFEYLIWYTKMFNLRFYLEPGTRKVSILKADNFIKQLSPLDIQNRVCYDREYTKSRKIIDEGYLKFNLTPNKNATIEAYEKETGKEILDTVFAVPGVEGKGEKEYLNTNLKVGSKGRINGTLNRRQENGHTFFGFNQNSPFTVTYVSGSIVDGDQTFLTDDVNLNFQQGIQRYDFLNLQDDIDDTVVMFSGLKDTPFTSPAILSATSLDMVKYAGKPCYLGGLEDGVQGTGGVLLGAQYVYTYKIPSYGLVPSLTDYNYGLSYSNVDYDSLIVTDNIYDMYLKDFVEKIYSDPLVVECYVRLNSPELRRLYWFDNNYWILTEISNYNYRDEPVKCKFIRYRTDA